MNLFRVRGIQLAVHFSFFLFLAYVGFEGWRFGELTGMILNMLTVIVLFTCVVLHELGHSFTAMSFGVGVRRILLMPIGGMAEFDSIPREPAREFLITIAGPAVNFVIAGVLCLFVSLPNDWGLFSFPDYPATWTGFAQLVIHWNLLMGCFNLVPAFPMDGGRILRAVFATRMPYLRATFVAATLGKILASAAVLVALFVFDKPLTAVLFAFIFFAGEIEYRAVRRRELDDAHWRATLARLYASQPPAEEPPLLIR